MRFISADYIFPVTSPPVKNGIVVLNDSGTIIDLIKSEPPNHKAEIYEGIICPGFINAHCHLELSAMKGMITENTGLTGFIKELMEKRSLVGEEKIIESIAAAEGEMITNGIAAVGDISNNALTFLQKSKGNIFYHTFIEVFDLNPAKARETFENGIKLKEMQYAFPDNRNKMHNSIVPHAPYSVSNNLLKMIYDGAIKNNSLISMHNQESESENELFRSKTGKMAALFKNLNNPLEYFSPTGKSSLQSVLMSLPAENNILLVHNTFSTKEDIQFAQDYSKNIYWCFCPNANLYIENKLPDFKIFINGDSTCCIGTDSYASNWSLSVLDELKTISKFNPEISLQTLLCWATINGATFFGIENQTGSIEKNKMPGLNLIENVNLETLQLTDSSKTKKLA